MMIALERSTFIRLDIISNILFYACQTIQRYRVVRLFKIWLPLALGILYEPRINFL